MFIKFLLLLLSISNEAHQRIRSFTRSLIDFATTNGPIFNPLNGSMQSFNLLNGWYFAVTCLFKQIVDLHLIETPTLPTHTCFRLCVFTFPISILILHSNDANNLRTCTNTFLSFTFDSFFCSLMCWHFPCPNADDFTHNRTSIIFAYIVLTSSLLPTLLLLGSGSSNSSNPMSNILSSGAFINFNLN